MTDQLELRYVPLSALRRWDRNAKRHDLSALAASIARHGFRDPPAFDAALNGGEGGVVEGNGRGDALSLLRAQGQPRPRGILDGGDDWLVPVLFGLDADSQAAAESYGISHNNLTLAGGDFTDLDMARMWDAEGYAAVLEDLARAGETPVGVDESALDALLAALREPLEGEAGGGGDEFDATPADGPTRCQPGNLWVIGGVHRLIIGDSTDPATVARLMGGERADMAWCDPPFGIDLQPQRGLTSAIANDGNKDARALWAAFVPLLFESLKENTVAFLCQDWSEFDWTLPIVRQCFTVKSKVVWYKNNFGIGYYLRPQHEDVLYCWKGTPPKPTEAISDVWEVARLNAPEHAAEKPVALMQRAVGFASPVAGVVVDWFAGVGGTLVACHRTGRRVYLCEIEPRYGDVILRRAEAEGLTVERVEP